MVVISGNTNYLRIGTIGEIKDWGTGIGKDSVIGKARVIEKEEDLHHINDVDILIVVSTDKNYSPDLYKVKVLVDEEEGLTFPSAVPALELKITTIVGVESVADVFSNGELVSLDSSRKFLYK